MHGDEDVVAVLGREHRAGVEAHAVRRDVRAELDGRRVELAARAALAVLGVGQVALVAERVAEVHALLRRAVQRVVGQVVADPVAGVVGEPEVLGARVPVEADRVAHAARVDLHHAGLGIDAVDRRLRVGRHDDVARRADVEVELAVGAGREELPEVAGLLRGIEVVDHHLRLGRVGEPVLDALVGRDAVALGHVERAVVEGDAVRRVQALEDLEDRALAVAVDDRVDVLQVAVADEDRALVAEGERARLGDAVGVDLDLEAGGELELVERELAGGAAGEDGGEGVEGGGGLVGGAALLPGGGGGRSRGRRGLRVDGSGEPEGSEHRQCSVASPRRSATTECSSHGCLLPVVMLAADSAPRSRRSDGAPPLRRRAGAGADDVTAAPCPSRSAPRSSPAPSSSRSRSTCAARRSCRRWPAPPPRP